ncbi:MAG: FadR family transcriptional regulator [Anaerolineales bacterium]|nr:FadR family transcriptional regulator [Anaerolineales bacterium]
MDSNFMLRPPQKVTIVDSIIEQVITQIKDGTLKAGDKLPSERQLINMLSVSRSSVREALQALAAMNLVEVRPGEGTFIEEPNPSFGVDMDIETLSDELQREMRHHLNQARLTLELGIASLAANKVTETAGQNIRQAFEAYNNAHNSLTPDVDSWSVHDQVHLAIAEATGNPILVQILRTLLEHVPMMLRKKGLLNLTPEKRTSRREKELEIHRQLCMAIIQGDESAACEWTHHHAELEAQIINEYYGQTEPRVTQEKATN